MSSENLKETRYWLLLITVIAVVAVVCTLTFKESCESECKKYARTQMQEIGIAPVKANAAVFNAQVEFCMPICKRQRERAEALKAIGGDEPL